MCAAEGIHKKINSTAICWCMAGLLAAVLLCLMYFLGNRTSERSTPAVVLLGDSILGEYREEDSVSALMEQRLHMQVYNGALGGTLLARGDGERRMDSRMDSFSMAALSKAIVSGDFRIQQGIHPSQPATWYFEETLDGLEQVDFSKVKYLVIEHGINDYQSGVPLDNPENPYDEYTYAGALRSTLKALQKKYPALKILLVSPTYSWYLEMEKTCEEFDAGGGILEEYVLKEQETAREYGAGFLDLYHDFYAHEKWEDHEIFTRDGLHPNAAGREKIADAISEYMEENP